MNYHVVRRKCQKGCSLQDWTVPWRKRRAQALRSSKFIPWPVLQSRKQAATGKTEDMRTDQRGWYNPGWINNRGLLGLAHPRIQQQLEGSSLWGGPFFPAPPIETWRKGREGRMKGKGGKEGAGSLRGKLEW